MKRKLGKILGILLVIALVTTLASCKEKHTREYIEKDDEKIYYVGTYDVTIPNHYNELNYDYSSNKISCKCFKEVIKNKNEYEYYRTYYSNENGVIYYESPALYKENRYDIFTYLIYDGRTDTVCMNLENVIYRYTEENIRYDAWYDLSCTLTFENDTYSVNYIGQNLVEHYVGMNYEDSKYNRDEITRLEELQQKYINIMIECREEALNLEVKSEDYYVEVNFFDWYDPWGKILTIGISSITLVFLASATIFLLKRLPDSNE